VQLLNVTVFFSLYVQIGDRFYIYLEYVHPGSINRYVQQHSGVMTESMIRNFTRHILNGLAYLHSMNIMHRYIPTNAFTIFKFLVTSINI
jgi:serine/threonine protein kinase